MNEAVKSYAITDQYNEKYVKSGLLTEVASASAYKNVGTMDKSVKYSAAPDKQNEASVEVELIPKGASAISYENFGTMDEAVSSADITDQQNKEYYEAEVLIEGSSVAHEDIDADARAHTKETKYQDEEASANSKVPRDVPAYHDVPVEG